MVRLKMSTKIGLFISVIFLTVFVTNLYSLCQLAYTDVNITKAYFTPYYYAKVTDDRYDMEHFIEYMDAKGWTLSEQMGGGYRFEKGDKTKFILNTQVKTVMTPIPKELREPRQITLIESGIDEIMEIVDSIHNK